MGRFYWKLEFLIVVMFQYQMPDVFFHTKVGWVPCSERNSRKRLPQREILQCLVGEGSKSESMSSRVNRSSIFLWIRNEWFRQFIMMIMCFVPIKLLVDVDSQPCPNPFKTIILAQSSLRSPGRMALARRPAIFSRPRDASAEWVKAARVIMDTSGQNNACFYRKH